MKQLIGKAVNYSVTESFIFAKTMKIITLIFEITNLLYLLTKHSFFFGIPGAILKKLSGGGPTKNKR